MHKAARWLLLLLWAGTAPLLAQVQKAIVQVDGMH